MAPLFASKQVERTRLLPNGGLGGCVAQGVRGDRAEELEAALNVPAQKSTHRKRPPPIQTSCFVGREPAFVSQIYEGWSCGYGGQWTPTTPTDRLTLSLGFGCALNPGSAPLIPQCSSAMPCAPCCSLPQTPVSPVNSLPVELPGSLLLASQGFPQTHPISPPPSLRLVRRDTDDSTTSSVPTLSTSVSSELEGDTMDALRSLTTPLRKHDRQTDNTMPAYVIENRATEDLKITKPLSAMSMEELLEYLPQCNPSMITHFWLPAVRAQLQKMTSLLNDVGELKIESSLGQIALQKDLKSFTDEIRLIATSYHKVLESAESLVERDTKACHERLKELENQVEEALERMGAKDEEIAEQEREIEELTHTIYDVTRVLGSFIHDNVSNWVETLNEPRTEEVLEIISDYSYDVGKAQTVRYVRVPEAMIARYARDLREANELADEYRELLRGQSAMINEHSHNLDTYTNKYEIAVRVVKERDHEVLLLTQKNETLTKRLEECEAALVQSQESIAEVESKAGRYDELRGNLESLKIAHTLELAQCEEEIARLRQMLGSAREEVFARRADVKNIISQSQAAIPNPDLPATTAKGGPASKALRFFGVDRDKERIKRGGGIPSSQSMIGFTSSHHDASTHAFDTRYSSKEVTTSKSKPFLRNVSPLGKRRQARTTPTTPVESSESRSGSITSLPAVVRPRSDSLGATKRHGILASPINTHKALPNPPNRSQPLLASAARLAEVTQDVDSSTASQIASDYLENSILGQTAARRVLSNIPEVSVYGPSDAGDGDREEDHVPEYEDGSDRSVASSDREVYRRSVCALDMLNSSALPYSETETELERMLRGVTEPEQDRNNHHYHRHSTYDGGDEHGDAAAETELGVARILHLRPGNHNLRASRARERNGDVERDERYRQSFVSDSSGYRSEGSEPMTVAQLYHQGGRHIRD